MEGLEQIIAKAKAYDEMMEHQRQKARENYNRNRQVILQRRRQWYDENRDEILKKQKQWYKDNRTAILERMRIKRERKRAERDSTPAGEDAVQEELQNEIQDEIQDEEGWNESFSRENEANLLD